MRTTALRSLIASALVFGVVSSAHAIPMLRLSTSAGGSATASDSDADGVVSYNGSLTGWSVNVTNGFSKPTLGSANIPILDLVSFNLSSPTAGGSIDILLTDTDFTALPSPTNMLAAIGGTTSGGNISFKAFFD